MYLKGLFKINFLLLSARCLVGHTEFYFICLCTWSYRNISQAKRGHEWRPLRKPWFYLVQWHMTVIRLLGGGGRKIKSSKLASATLVSLRPACATWNPILNKTRAAGTAAQTLTEEPGIQPQTALFLVFPELRIKP